MKTIDKSRFYSARELQDRGIDSEIISRLKPVTMMKKKPLYLGKDVIKQVSKR